MPDKFEVMARNSSSVLVFALIHGVVLGCIVELSLWSGAFDGLRGSISLVCKNIALSGILITGIASFLLTIAPARFFAHLVLMTIFMGLALGNFYKLQTLGQPIIYSDIWTPQPLPLLTNYVDWSACLLLMIATSAFIWAAEITSKKWIAKSRALQSGFRGHLIIIARIVSIIVGTLALAICVAPPLTERFAAPSRITWERSQWHPTTYARSAGQVRFYLSSSNAKILARQAGYELSDSVALFENSNGALTAAVPFQMSQRRVLILMLESFVDPHIWGIRFAVNPIPFLTKLFDQSGHQKIISPAFGRETANAEFELLTGIPHALLDTVSTPFTSFVKSRISSVVNEFQAAGYASVALHNFTEGAWNRKSVYPKLGFSRFRFLNDMDDNTRIYDWPTDRVLFAEIEKELRREGPRLVYGLTVNTHSPYVNYFSKAGGTPDGLNLIEPEELRRFGANSFALAALASYLAKVRLLDSELESLFGRIDQRNLDIYILGDHHPLVTAILGNGKSPINDRSEIEKALQHSMLDRRNFEVPFVHLRDGIPSRVPELDGQRGIHCLGPVILAHHRIPVKGGLAVWQNVCKRYPSIHHVGLSVYDQKFMGLLKNFAFDELVNGDKLFGAQSSQREFSNAH